MSQQYEKLAKRYAKALHQAVVREQGSEGAPTPAQRLAEELRRFLGLWSGVEELSATMLNPMFDKEERLRALLEVLRREGFSDTVQRFLRIVFERERIAAIPQIVEAFGEIADAAAGVVQVSVTVAGALAEDEIRNIESGLRSRINGTLVFSWTTDPTLIGGMVVRYGGKVLDGSLRGRLERIERRLLGEQIEA